MRTAAAAVKFNDARDIASKRESDFFRKERSSRAGVERRIYFHIFGAPMPC